MGPIQWNEIGIAGYAIVDTWMYYHCKILNSEAKAAECMKCFDTENATQMIDCTDKYLPKDFMDCWDVKEVIFNYNFLNKFFEALHFSESKYDKSGPWHFDHKMFSRYSQRTSISSM